MSSRILKLVCLAAVVSASPAAAEIVKSAGVGCKEQLMCFYWWPKLPTLKGWHADEKAGYAFGENGVNLLVPNGFSIENADTVMYGQAVFKERYAAENPKVKSLAQFIAADRSNFLKRSPQISIADAPPLTTADGQRLASLTYFHPKDKSWERVAYGEEGEYYLLFVITAHSEPGYRKNMPAYESLVARYRK